MTRTIISLTLAALLLPVAFAAAPTPAQDAAALDALLKSVAVYDGGLESAPLWKLRDVVWAAKDDPAARAALESRLLDFLVGKATAPAKMTVAKHLRIIGSEKAVPVLQPYLLDRDLCDTAIYALAKIPSPAVDKALIESLPRAIRAVKPAIISVLGDRGAAESVLPLANLLTGQGGEFAGPAATALGAIGGVESANALMAAYAGLRPEVRTPAAGALLRCAESLRAARSDRAALPLYDKLLADAALPAPLRTGAMIGKIHVAGDRALPLLLDQFKGADAAFQAAAVASLKDIVKPEAISVVCELLPGRPESVQIPLLAALASYPREKVQPTVLKAAREGSPAVRLAALKAVERVGDASVVPFLLEASVKAKGAEQAAARAALAGLKGGEVDTALTAALRSTEPSLQAECLLALGLRQAYAAKSAIVPFLASPAAAVRVQAARALRTVGTPSDLYAALDACLKAGDDAERLEAAATVAALAQKIGQADGRAAAVKARLEAEKAPAAKALLIGLCARIGDDGALPAVRAALASPEAAVGEAAARALAAWPTPAARFDALLLARSAKDETLRLLALQGYLRMIGLEKYARPQDATAALKDAAALAVRPEEKRLVLAALTAFACAESLALAESMAADAAVAAEAKAAAAKIKEKLSGK